RSLRSALRARCAPGSESGPRREISLSQGVRLGVSLVVLAAALLLLQLGSTGETVPVRKPLGSFPAAVGQWEGRGGTVFGPSILEKLKLTDYVMRDYLDPSGRRLNLYIAYWDTQRKGAIIHSPKNCLPGAGWEPVESALAVVPLAPPHHPITVNR